LDTQVRLKVRKIFEHLRKQQPKMEPRKRERVNVDQTVREHRQFNANETMG